MNPFQELFKDGIESIVKEFSGYYGENPRIREDLNGATVLLAWYKYEDYSGDAIVVYEKDGKLYEVNGSHCSCYGLEGQWEPEETTLEALTMRSFYDVSKQAALDGLLAARGVRKA